MMDFVENCEDYKKIETINGDGPQIARPTHLLPRRQVAARGLIATSPTFSQTLRAALVELVDWISDHVLQDFSLWLSPPTVLQRIPVVIDWKFPEVPTLPFPLDE